ncbi:hypothetical protein PVAND_015509 [Polypedilum vanderplanki]|uniref:Uncharacterized protein n=1 Tax=Polypedilum vanderplanki TaxID=319348 RepID=A0A9J6BCU6_POLVA|nr:hypothetical protein PVAND_015509 [Polypedilum vanderplanki]
MKFFIITLAALSICALNSDAMYRKCKPVNPVESTTAAPTVAPTAAPTTVASTVNPALVSNLVSSINNGTTTLQSTQNQISQSVNTLQTSLNLLSSVNTNKNNTIILNGATAAINRIQSTNGTIARRKRSPFSFYTPTSCADVVTELTALNIYAQAIYAASGASGVIDMLNQTLIAISTTFTQLAPLAPTISNLISQIQTSSSVATQLITDINNLSALLGVMQVALCATAPPTTTSSFSGATLVFTPTCSYVTQTYANDTSINGIYAGIGIDKQPLYVGYKTAAGGLKIPGGLENSKAIVPGLYYSLNGAVSALEFSSVTYLQQGSSCGCWFIPSTDPIPTGGYLVTVNSGANIYGFGLYTDSSTLSYSYQVIGRINPYNNVMYFFDALSFSEKSTTTYKKLVCVSGTVTTTTAPATTTPGLLLNINQTRDALVTLITSNYAILASIKDDTTAVISTISDLLSAGNLLTSTQITALQSTLTGFQTIAFPTLTAPTFPINPADWCNSVQAVIDAIPGAINTTTTAVTGFGQVVGIVQNVLSTGQVSLTGIGTMINSFQGMIIAGTITTYINDFSNLLNNYNHILSTYDYFKTLFASSTCNLTY